MNKKFWKNKRVLITGFEGFLGSNLTQRLVSSGAKIFGLDIKVRRKDTILTPHDYKKIRVIRGSVANYKLLAEVIQKNKIEFVFHLAAEAIVGACYNEPLRNFSTNTEGTWKLLEACRKAGNLEAIIIASSDKAYGTHKELPYDEKAPLVGRHPYDVSKSCADLIACAYAHTYGLPVAVTRCGNIYGPGDFNFSRIVPDAIRCALNGRKLQIRSNGKFIRDYVFVEDIVNGYIELAENLKKLKLSGEAFNLSDEHPIQVIELVHKIFAIAGRKRNYKILNTARYEIKNQYLSSKKIRRIIDWKPRFNLEEGLSKTIGWYADVRNSR